MFKRLFTSVLVITFSLLSVLSSADAVWKGTLNPLDKRTVPIFMDANWNACSTGFLYAPRIVFTVAHAAYFGDDRVEEQTVLRPTIWVGWPIDTINTVSSSNPTGTRRIASEKIFIADGYKDRDYFRGGNRISRINDFAVIVLPKPLPVDDKKVILLTPELHQQYIDSGEQINLTGYGSQNASDVEKACDGRKPSSFQSPMIGKTVGALGNGITWTETLNFKVQPGMPNLCNGDSGSPYTKILSDSYVYLGAASSSFNQHNCESFPPALSKESINGADPVYLFKDLIAKAEKYVADNPYVAPNATNSATKKKTTINCIKGNATTKVTGTNPKCPAGYAKK